MLIGARRPTAYEDPGVKQLVKELTIRFLFMHALLQCPRRLYSSLVAREPFQNQVSSRHQRTLIWVILLGAGVPGSLAWGRVTAECAVCRVQTPRPHRPCTHLQPLPREVRPSHTLSPEPATLPHLHGEHWVFTFRMIYIQPSLGIFRWKNLYYRQFLMMHNFIRASDDHFFQKNKPLRSEWKTMKN